MLLPIRFLVLSVFLGLMIASCQSQANKQQASTANHTNCRTIEHEAGETEVCGETQRIVVLGPYVLEPLLALGVQPVAYGDHVAFHQGEYENPKAQIPYLGGMITQPVANVGTAYEPSIEAIALVQPDLIIGTEGIAKQYDTLSQIAPTMLLRYADTENNLKAIATAVDRTQQAKQLLEETKQKIAVAREAFAPVVAKNPNVLLITSSQLKEIAPLDSHTTCTSLPEQLGFKLVPIPGVEPSQPNTSPPPISIETLPKLNNADSIIVFGYDFEEKKLNNFDRNQLSKIKRAWKNNAIAQSMDASKAGQVYFIPTYLCAGLPGAIGTKLYLEELEKQLLSLH
ncbi:MAG: iron-siderophore ABC transporter substrate-binding protein [Cyanobacteria bacterium P01_G01_bin.67]